MQMIKKEHVVHQVDALHYRNLVWVTVYFEYLNLHLNTAHDAVLNPSGVVHNNK